jgi:nitrate/nitrite transporter NarK
MVKVERYALQNPYMKWVVLLLVGLVLFSNYYFYDAFSSLKGQLQSELNINSSQYGLYVSLYSFPNTFLFMAIIGGIILDRFGIRRTGFGFVFMMALGAVFSAYGTSDYFRAGGFGYDLLGSFWTGYSPELKMLLLGRLLFGLGAETSIVVMSKILVKWFRGRNLALAFGLKVGFGRLGTALALMASPRLSEGGQQMDQAIWLAAILILVGFLAFIVYMMMDMNFDKKGSSDMQLLCDDERFELADIKEILGNKAFIYIALLCVTFYSAVFPFVSFAPDLMANKFGLSDKTAGDITALLPIGTAIFTPIFGILIDRYGKSATAMIGGALTLILVHTIFRYTMISPYVPIVLLGIAFSLVPAAMWPSMVKLVKEKQVGTAYGIMYSIQNLGLWAMPLVTGIILENTNPEKAEVLDYSWFLMAFIAVSILGLFFAIRLKIEDSKNGFGVELPLNKK